MANKRWIGGAPAVADVWTLTFANVWAAADTATVTINNKNLILTAGSGVLNDLATYLANAINASAPINTAGFTSNYGGQQWPEFAELSAVANGATVVITGNTAGLPLTITTSETTAGSGTLTAVNTTPATGPNHFDNADNWDTGTLPANLDDLYFDSGAVDCLFGLTLLRASTFNCNIYITNDWTGQLGLPNLNPAGYKEYRQRYFQFKGTSGKDFHVLEGTSGANNQKNLWVDFTDQASADIRIRARRGNTGATPTIFLAGAAALKADGHLLLIYRGAVHVEPDDAGTASNRYFVAGVNGIAVGVVGGSATDCFVYFGKNARLAESTALEVNSGSVFTEASTYAGAGVDLCPIRIYAGGLVETRSESQHDDITVEAGGQFFPVGASALYGDIKVRGTLDTRRAISSIIPDTLRVYAGASIYDPAGKIGNVIDFVGCTPAQLTTLQLPPDRQLDYSALATP